jgi:hypothetical protein
VYCHNRGGRVIGNRYGPGTGQIWLDDVQCAGYESSIMYCQHLEWGINICQHSEDVSISCDNNIAHSTITPGLERRFALIDTVHTLKISKVCFQTVFERFSNSSRGQNP